MTKISMFAQYSFITIQGEKMNAIDLAKGIIAAIEADNFDFIRKNSTGDMVFNGPGGRSLDKKEFIALFSELMKALPDCKFNATNFKQVGDRVTYTNQVSGTHTGVLDLHMPNVPVLQPTNRQIHLPQEPVTVYFRDGMFYRVDVGEVPGGGLNGILTKLSVRMPQTSFQK
jgi:hypothetical protein